MLRVILTVEVEDAGNWEAAVRANTDSLTQQTVTAFHFTITANNKAAIYLEVDDAEKMFEFLRSQATVEQMELDGVKRESVEVFFLDKEIKPGGS